MDKMLAVRIFVTMLLSLYLQGIVVKGFNLSNLNLFLDFLLYLGIFIVIGFIVSFITKDPSLYRLLHLKR